MFRAWFALLVLLCEIGSPTVSALESGRYFNGRRLAGATAHNATRLCLIILLVNLQNKLMRINRMVSVFRRRSLLIPFRKLLYRDEQPALTNAVLNALDLNGAAFICEHMKGVSLAGSSLRAALFCRSDLSHSSLVEVNLYLALFDRCKLNHARLNDSDLTLCHFKESQMDYCDLSRAILHGTRFHKASLCHANFAGANCFSSKGRLDFAGSDLRQASFRSVVFSYYSFRDCDLRGTDFSQTAFVFGVKKGDFEGALMDDRTLWPPE
jgi:uncharacterized protein YjbI with pentapeptide repeats